MDFESAIQQELGKIPEINEKIFPLKARDDSKLPYIVYVSCERMPDKAFDGFRNSDKISLEINLLHSNYRKMKELSRLVIDEVKKWNGQYIGDGSVWVQSLVFDSESKEQYEREVDAYRKMILVSVHI